MRAIEIAFAILVFDVCTSLVIHSQLTTVPPVYYESGYVDVYGPNGSLPANISTVSETQQYATTMDVTNVIISTLTLDWIYQFIPASLHESFAPFIIGLDAIMVFFIAVALIEFFIKQGSLFENSGSGGGGG